MSLYKRILSATPIIPSPPSNQGDVAIVFTSSISNDIANTFKDNQSTTSVDIQQPLIYNAILPWNKVVHHETMSSLFAAVRCWIPSLVEGAVCDNDLQGEAPDLDDGSDRTDDPS